jgi:hypothetical protein
MNVELLLKVKETILTEPRKFIMGDWAINIEGWRKTRPGDVPLELPDAEYPPCGTVACISGWATIISRYGGDPNKLFEERGVSNPWLEEDGQEALDLSDREALRLFFESNWPTQFSDRWETARTQQERAQVAADRIDFFIATHGTDDPSEADHAL